MLQLKEELTTLSEEVIGVREALRKCRLPKLTGEC